MTTLTAFYDLSVGPVSFDFVVFLVKAELERRRLGAQRMHVVIVPMAGGMGGMFRHKPQYDEHEARWRLWNILIPAPALFGASVTLATDWLQAGRMASSKVWKLWPHDWDKQTLKERRHLVGDLITAANRGEEIPLLSASEHARRWVREWYRSLGRPVVTMTLRDTYLPERNAVREDWMAAREHIYDRGYEVVLMEDTSVALSKGYGYGELNLDLRAACYEEAALNLQANNGAASLCWFGPKPYRMFGAGVPADEWHGLFVRQGLELGKSWPWALPQQKLVYGRTTADQIVGEFEAWESGTR